MSDSETELPLTFYFNGVPMPKWGWCWGAIGLNGFIDPQKGWDQDIGPRDIYILECRIDHVGSIESAAPDVFRYAAQAVLCILLEHREAVFEKLRRLPDFPADPAEVYHDLVEACFQMRELAIREGRAFWTRGCESDRLLLVEAIRRASLPLENPDYAPPPHIRSLNRQLEWFYRNQARTLHRVASTGGLSKELRKRLLDITDTRGNP